MDWTMTAERAPTADAPRIGRVVATRLNGDPAALAEQLPELGPVSLRVGNGYASQSLTGELTHSGWVGNALWLGGWESGVWLYPSRWEHAFAVAGGEPKARQDSLQFVDRAGEVSLTAELTPSSEREALAALIGRHRQAAARRPIVTGRSTSPVFPGIIRHAVDPSLVRELLETLADAAVPVRIELANQGALPSYTGLIDNPVATQGGLTVRGSGMCLELDLAAVASAWVANMEVADGRAHVVDLFDAEGRRVLRLAGRRVPGGPEERAWRTLVEALSPCHLSA